MNLCTRRDFIKGTAVLAGLPGGAVSGGRLLAADRTPLPPDALELLRAKLKGRLVLPGDSLYEGARKVFYWNPKTERKPAAIVQCAHEEDAVRAAKNGCASSARRPTNASTPTTRPTPRKRDRRRCSAPITPGF